MMCLHHLWIPFSDAAKTTTKKKKLSYPLPFSPINNKVFFICKRLIWLQTSSCRTKGPYPRFVFIGPSSRSFVDASPSRSRFPPSVSSAPKPDATDAARALLTFSSHDSRLIVHGRGGESAKKDQIVKVALYLSI